MTGDALAAVERQDRPLSRRMRSAALWSGLNSFVLRLGQFLVGVVTARIIAPHEFGVFAVALTVHAVISNISELGASAALVRAKGDIGRIAPTVATISLASSAVLTVAMLLSAPSLAGLLGAPDAANVIRVLSVTVLVGGVTAVPYAILVREFRQDKRFIADAANFVSSTGLIVVLGLAGYGAMALAVAKLIGLLVSLALLFAMIRPRYLPGWDRAEAGRVLRYSLPLAGASLITFSLGNIDYVVVGHLLGPLALGLYVLAFNVSGWPVSVFSLMINEVALPAFAHVRDDLDRLASRTASALGVTALAAFPVSALILALSPAMVAAVYGSRWQGAVSALAVLGIFGSMRILLTLLTNVLVAVGRSRSVLFLQGSWIVVLFPALVIGVRRDGIVGAAVAQECVALLVVAPIALRMVSRSGAGSACSLVRPCLLALGASAAAGSVAYGVARLVHSPVTQLVAGGVAGVAVYLVLVARPARRRLAEAAVLWNDPPEASHADEPTVRPHVGRHRLLDLVES